MSQQDHGSSWPANGRSQLLVFYIADGDAIDRLLARTQQLGQAPVAPENP